MAMAAVWGCSAGKLGKAAFSHGFSACGIEQVTETSTIQYGTLSTSDVEGKALLVSCTPSLWVWLLRVARTTGFECPWSPRGERAAWRGSSGQGGGNRAALATMGRHCFFTWLGKPSQTKRTTKGERSSTAVSLQCPYCSPGKEHPGPATPKVSPRCIKTTACFVPASAVKSHFTVLVMLLVCFPRKVSPANSSLPVFPFSTR